MVVKFKNGWCNLKEKSKPPFIGITTVLIEGREVCKKISVFLPQCTEESLSQYGHQACEPEHI